MLHFRALTNADLERSPSWWEGRSLAQDRWRDDETRSALAIEAGEIVGAGAIWLSRVHADRFSLDIVVHPDHRRRGVGNALLRHLSLLRSQDAPFEGRGYEGDEALLIADAWGAHTVQVVPPSRVDIEGRHALRAHPRVQPLAGVDRSKTESAYAQLYRWTHETWSPVREGFERALADDLWAGLNLDASSAAVDGSGRILALALAYLDSDPALIVAETVSREQPDGERLVEGCIRRSLDGLASSGHTHADFDGHVSDPHFLPVLARLEPSGRWFRLVEIPAP